MIRPYIRLHHYYFRGARSNLVERGYVVYNIYGCMHKLWARYVPGRDIRCIRSHKVVRRLAILPELHTRKSMYVYAVWLIISGRGGGGEMDDVEETV